MIRITINEISATAVVFIFSCLLSSTAMAQAPGHRVRECLYLPPHVDMQMNQIDHLLSSESFRSPVEGQQVVFADGSTRNWRSMKIEEPTVSFDVDSGGWIHCEIDGVASGTGLATISGHESFYLNGLRRPSMPVAIGQMKYPIQLQDGKNHLLIKVGSGPIGIKIQASDQIESDVHILQYDRVLPWLLDRHHVDEVMGLLVLNSGDERLAGLRVATKTQFVPMNHWADYPDDAVPGVWQYTDLASLPANSFAKVPMRVVGPPPHKRSGLPYPVDIEIQKETEAGFETLASTVVNLSSRNKGNAFIRTWLDDHHTTQQCIIMAPEADYAEVNTPTPVVISIPTRLRSVTQTAYAYEEGREAIVIVPTSRRPEISGSALAHDYLIEAIELADQLHGIDHDRIIATGFSDGGLDAIALAEARPGLLSGVACIGADVPLRNGSVLNRNLDAVDLLVRHGQYDSTITLGMGKKVGAERESLKTRTLVEIVPEMERWWGAQTIADESIDDFLLDQNDDIGRPHSIQLVDRSDTRSHRDHWAVVHQRENHDQPAELNATMVDGNARITTTNVRQLLIRGEALLSPGPLKVNIDAQDLVINSDVDELCLQQLDGSWEIAARCDVHGKSKARSCYQDLFRRPLVLIHGTRGDEVQNRHSWAKARFDAEYFWSVADGRADVVADTDVTDEMLDGVNVILYGNAETNSLWSRFMVESPIEVGSGGITIGEEEFEGGDLAVIFIRPLPGDPEGLVLAAGVSGAQASEVMQSVLLTHPARNYPDWMLFKSGQVASPIHSGSFQRAWELAP